MTDKIRVEFITNCSPYNAGEVAGFLPKDAEKLRQRRIVKFLDEEPDEDIIVDENENGDVKGSDNGDDKPSDDDTTKSGDGKGKSSKKATGKAKGTRKKKRVRVADE